MRSRRLPSQSGHWWTAGVLLALVVSAVPLGGGEAQTVVRPEPADERALTSVLGAEMAVVDRAVLVNAADVERLARRWYAALDGTSSLGEGSVVVYARVLSDGTVAAAVVPEAGPHHPALNALARRVAREMVFTPVDTAGEAIVSDDRDTGNYWVAQRIDFRR